VDKKEYYAALEAAGHLLVRDSGGSVAYLGDDPHRGPMCELCHEQWCQHCPDEITPCEVGVIDSTCEVVGNTNALAHDG